MRVAIVLATGVVLSGALSRAEAQGPRRGGRGGYGSFGPEPTWWGSVSGGYQWSNLVGDPGTSSVWDFDANWALRLTAERLVAPRTTIGLGYTYARLPLTIRGNSAATACRIPCAADATIARYGVVAHSGGGPGLHLVYEGFLGAAQYSNFTVQGDGTAAFADVKNTDFAWSIGTGAGYGLSHDFALQAIFDYGSSLHEKASDLFQRRTTQHYTVRFGVRAGL
ncbi:MAG: hypothetical protein ABI910_16255 [Gemmatimonadota bacterium]